MREILFRAWIKKEKMINPVYSLYFGEDDQSIQVSGCGRVGCCICTDEYQPDEVILMQYTGLDSKSKAKIFEDDIIAGPSTYTMLVVIKDGHTMVQFTDTDIGDTEPKLRMLEQRHIDEYGIEIIGNIYENHELLPELLEVEE